MSKKIHFVCILLFLLSGLNGCGKKEATDQAETVAGVITDVKAQAVVPGEMVFIPAGKSIMGSDDSESSAYPERELTLPAFWIDKYEVTYSQFLDFAINTDYLGEGAKEGKDWRTFFTPDKARFPVVYITWKDADAYCKSAGKRLPTEEEWEKAGRGADGRRYPWGDEWVPGRSNTYEARLTRPAAVGHFFDDVSPYGVRDLLGNVQEWTADWYSTNAGNPKKDPNSGQRFRVIRGLSSRYPGAQGALWTRSYYLPNAVYDFGFRCAKDYTPEEDAKAGQSP